ncbi:unnamed protein product [Mytilus coruscus]|uniref:DZIP3-like HEPN domain-containing protein n=1 Tax=Mytilus coruscus TaxID=42192 RepID=A0A6J8CG10_MYTCO|nr:unnamed protein product [Mytilus coruscus]
MRNIHYITQESKSRWSSKVDPHLHRHCWHLKLCCTGQKIKDAANKGSYTDFDIPLIYTILRNIHYSTLEPTNGWDSKIDPQPHQIKTGDDLERCRRRRNKIIHRGNTEVSDLELNEYFDEFGAIASRLQVICNKQNNEFVLEVKDLRTCCMDEDTERTYLEEIER